MYTYAYIYLHISTFIHVHICVYIYVYIYIVLCMFVLDFIDDCAISWSCNLSWGFRTLPFFKRLKNIYNRISKYNYSANIITQHNIISRSIGDISCSLASFRNIYMNMRMYLQIFVHYIYSYICVCILYIFMSMHKYICLESIEHLYACRRVSIFSAVFLYFNSYRCVFYLIT